MHAPPSSTFAIGLLVVIALTGLVGIAAVEVVRGDLRAITAANMERADPNDAGAPPAAVAHAQARARAAQYLLLGLTAGALGVGGALAIRRARVVEAAAIDARVAHDQLLWARREVATAAHELQGQAQVIGRAAGRLLARPGQPGDLELVRIQNASAQLERAVATLVDGTHRR